MIFCEKCFKLEEICQIIKSGNGPIKKCKIDSSHDLSITFDTEINKETLDSIKNIITPILDLYEHQKNLPKNFPEKKWEI